MKLEQYDPANQRHMEAPGVSFVILNRYKHSNKPNVTFVIADFGVNHRLKDVK
jgi:hypothetical protein